MDRKEVQEIVNFSGSVASITGISLLALEGSYQDLNISLVLSYVVGSSLFLGCFGLTVSFFIGVKNLIFARFNSLAAYSSTLVIGGLGLAWTMFLAAGCYVIAKELKYTFA
jgi:hypothetical protein